MALSAAQKQRIVELFAIGKKAREVAAEVGCSEASVNRYKNLSKNDKFIKTARKAIAAKTIDEQGAVIVETLQLMAEREPQIQEQMWEMFEGLSTLFSDVLRMTDPEDISPRQLPGLAKSIVEIATAYADFSDRINGLTILADEVEKLSEDRTTKPPTLEP